MRFFQLNPQTQGPMNLPRNAKQWVILGKEAKWRVSTLAHNCGISVRTLQRHFIKRFRISPREWLAVHRQLRAAELLRGGRSVKEAAFELCYNQPTNFARQFKKRSGTRPSETARKYAFGVAQNDSH